MRRAHDDRRRRGAAADSRFAHPRRAARRPHRPARGRAGSHAIELELEAIRCRTTWEGPLCVPRSRSSRTIGGASMSWCTTSSPRLVLRDPEPGPRPAVRGGATWDRAGPEAAHAAVSTCVTWPRRTGGGTLPPRVLAQGDATLPPALALPTIGRAPPSRHSPPTACISARAGIRQRAQAGRTSMSHTVCVLFALRCLPRG
jgi:hypothetical protein